MGISTALYRQTVDASADMIDADGGWYDTDPSYEPVEELPSGSAADPFL